MWYITYSTNIHIVSTQKAEGLGVKALGLGHGSPGIESRPLLPSSCGTTDKPLNFLNLDFFIRKMGE